ncbi:hypothetical protein HQ587_08335 [bacterium]|nr:hypothetical protein [bacterium]
MTRETRRGTRIVITLMHIVIQVLMLWIIVRRYGVAKGDPMVAIQGILTHAAIMIGAFFIYYSIIKLITRRNVLNNKKA